MCPGDHGRLRPAPSSCWRGTWPRWRPGSVIGASTPIAGGGSQLSDDERAKAVNLASHWIGAIAADHGTNEAAAMAAVEQAASFTADEARGLVPLFADNQRYLGVERLDPPLIDDAGAADLEALVARLDPVSVGQRRAVQYSAGKQPAVRGCQGDRGFPPAATPPWPIC